MGYKLVPMRGMPVPIPNEWQKDHILKMYAQYKEISKDVSKSESLRNMYGEWAFGYLQALIAFGYEIVEEN